jgi:hypothetical protein
MARSITIVVTDDLDGSPRSGETITFSLDGVRYQIDLGQQNLARLAGTLAPFIASSRRVRRGARYRPVGPAGGSRVDHAAVRARAPAASSYGRSATMTIRL